MCGWSDCGDELMYLGGIVYLFYFVVIYEWLEKGMVKILVELERVIWDMIFFLNYDGISLVVDVLIGIISGFELLLGFF